MNHTTNEVELTRLLEALLPMPEGEKLPEPRFGRSDPPPAQLLPASDPLNQTLSPPAPLHWIGDKELGINVFVVYEAEPDGVHGPARNVVWARVEGDDPQLAGKSASAALVSEKGGRFIGRLIPLELGPDNRCVGRLRFGTVDEVRAKLGERITLDVFLMG